MTDYTELKRLTEALLASDDHADFPGWMAASDAFDNATGPAAILALIAENERLRESDQEATELCDTLSVLLGEIAVAVRGPEEPKSRHGFHDLPSRVKTVVSERDQLKAENEALRQSITDINSALELEYWSEYAGLDETRAILDAAMSKEPQP